MASSSEKRTELITARVSPRTAAEAAAAAEYEQMSVSAWVHDQIEKGAAKVKMAKSKAASKLLK